MFSKKVHMLKHKTFIITIVGATIIISGVIMNCTKSLKFDVKKAHHGENSFKSANDSSSFQWLKMRIKEGGYPLINQTDVESIIGETDLKLINSPSDLPRVTWIGHCTVLVQYRGINLLTDPHLTDRPALIDIFVPQRLTPPALSYEEMPKIDFIVISHNHYDHLDRSTVDMFGNSVMWYVPLGLKSWFEERSINSDKVVELDWWQSHQFTKDVNITFTPSVHWSKRLPWDTNKSLWGSWSIKIEDFNCWFGGDTAYDEKLFKEIGRRMGPYQLSFIPIGAYGPRHFMLKQHVDPAQAVLIHKDIKSEKSIPIHWGTFQLSHEPFLEPPKLLEKAMELERLPQNQFGAIKIGETLVVKKISAPKD
jgi:N-acyl-phosphatidylethanolamine-hydrolysing phospholipase D